MFELERQRPRTDFLTPFWLLPLLAAAAGAQTTAPERKLTVGDEYAQPSGSATCERTVKARVVAIDQVLTYNRLGAFLPSGMVFALETYWPAKDGWGAARIEELALPTFILPMRCPGLREVSRRYSKGEAPALPTCL